MCTPCDLGGGGGGGGGQGCIHDFLMGGEVNCEDT